MSELDMRKGYDPVTVVIYDRKKNTVMEEISLIAFEKSKSRVIAVGEEAAGFIDSKEEDIVVICPLKNGMIADYTVAQVMFRLMLKKASLLNSMSKPRIAVCAPPGITEVEQMAYRDAFIQAGAKEVSISEEPALKLMEELPSSYRLIVGIVQDKYNGKLEEVETGVRKEIWKEVCKDKIPSDHYEFCSLQREEKAMAITLDGSRSTLHMVFQTVCASRILEKKSIPDELYSEEELKKLREAGFQNVVYQIEGGEFNRFVEENGRGKARNRNKLHYIVICDSYAIEFLAESDPDITVTKK